MKDSVEVQPPVCDGLFIVLCVKKPGYHIPSTPFGDVSLDICHGSTTESMVSKLYIIFTSAGSAHVVNCSIASRTGGLS